MDLNLYIFRSFLNYIVIYIYVIIICFVLDFIKKAENYQINLYDALCEHIPMDEKSEVSLSINKNDYNFDN